ncbi:hypothetical protein E6C76_16025 [Pseudothauera nasutitermitis]|uniref:Tryptophan synthase subunit beta like protein n=1 Tax=Pseudothauera nasutitermitis TaxID=2565930 RepID=A0A4S4AVL1_9RHOO|nr:hypothetical protein [Pseudothauera nasutitermitis]THF64069.1 hypothetical protein E6C76_16025 [Pseudothauera nasutitermitis]
MVYIKRDEQGRVIAAALEPDGEGWTQAKSDEPDVAVFARALTSGDAGLADTDLSLVRVLEDVIDLLVERSVIRFTDLPAAAQEKLNVRRGARASRRLNLLDDDNGLL